MTKVCSKCRTEKPIDSFNRDADKASGYSTQCKLCKNAAKAALHARRKAERAASGVSPPSAPVAAPEPAQGTSVPSTPAEHLAQAFEERAATRQKRDTSAQLRAALDEIDRLRQEVEVIQYVNGRVPEVIVYKQPSWERSDVIACALASDWHVEEPVNKEAVHGLNEYNLDIARLRAELFFKHFLRLADIIARDANVRTLYLGALGDFFSGWIHDELLANCLLAPADATLFCKGLWFSGIDFLLRESSYVLEADMIPGNHGRMTKTMHFGNPTGTSLETVMYHSIVDRYHGNPRVRFNVSKHAMVYRRFFESFVMRLIHGYETKYNGGIGGLTIPLNKAIAQWDKGVRANCTALGHYHQRFDGGNFLVNGSLIGYNTYAQAIKASPEEASQMFFTIHARGGGEKSLVAPIWLDEKHKA